MAKDSNKVPSGDLSVFRFADGDSEETKRALLALTVESVEDEGTDGNEIALVDLGSGDYRIKVTDISQVLVGLLSIQSGITATHLLRANELSRAMRSLIGPLSTIVGSVVANRISPPEIAMMVGFVSRMVSGILDEMEVEKTDKNVRLAEVSHAVGEGVAEKVLSGFDEHIQASVGDDVLRSSGMSADMLSTLLALGIAQGGEA